MRKIDKYLFKKFTAYLFAMHKKLQSINVLHTLTEIESISEAPHWHVDLPDSIEKFNQTLSTKVRQHSRYYVKKLTNEVGEIKLKKIERDQISQNIVDTYLAWKSKTHAFVWDSQNYLNDFCVSNAYILEVQNEVVAIGFDSDTGSENIYFENFSYDSKYAKYSIGIILYHKMIENWINNKKKRIYLLGGNYEYKRHYNGICTMTRSGDIYRHPLIEKLCCFVGKKISFLQLPFKKIIVNVVKHLFLLKYYKKRFKQIALENVEG